MKINVFFLNLTLILAYYLLINIFAGLMNYRVINQFKYTTVTFIKIKYNNKS